MRLTFLGRRARLTSLLVVVLLVACFDRTKHPATPNGVLSPDLGERSSQKDGPFRVVFASPVGETEEGAEIGVVFDRPLRPVDRADLPPPVLTIKPHVEGVVRWVGTRALSFAPTKGALPSATDFQVELAGSTKALDGSTLGAAYSFSFSTPRPKLTNTHPHSGATGVLPTAPLELYFNQDVAPESVQRFGKLIAKGRTLAFKASQPSPGNRRNVRVNAVGKLPVDTEISFELAPEFSSLEGPRTAHTKLSTSFRTYGPLAVELSCARDEQDDPCRPGSSMSLSFNNAVRHGDVRRALTVTPSEPLQWPGFHDDDSMVTYVEIPGRRMSSSHRVTLAKGLRDEFGQTLQRAFVKDVRFEDPYPRVAVGISDGTLVPFDRQPIPIAAINVKKAAVVWASLSRSDIQRWSDTSELTLSRLVLGHGQAHRVPIPASVPPSRPVQATLDPFGLLSQQGLGVLGIAAEYQPDPRDYETFDGRLAKVSDLALTGKLSRHGSLIWVTRLSSGEPVPGAVLDIGTDGKRRYVADGNGLVRIPEKDFVPRIEYGSAPSKEVLFVSSGPDWSFERVSDTLPAWDIPVSTDFSGQLGIDGLLFTERGVYRPGDTLRVKGVMRRRAVRGSVVPKGEKLTLTLTSPNDEKVRSQTLTISDFGTFHADVRLPRSASLGSYRLSAELGKQTLNETVEVREYQPAEFDVDVKLESSRIRGDKLEVEVRGTYLFGGPMNGSAVEYALDRYGSAFTPPNSEEFSTDAHAYYSDLRQHSIRYGRLRGQRDVLDAQGSLRFSDPLNFADQIYPENVTVEASVTDPARRSVADRASTLVHPGEFYFGVRVPDSFVKGGTPVKPLVIAVTPDGRRLQKKARLELVERRWTTTREDRGGAYPETVSRLIDKVVARCELVTSAQGASCSLPAPGSGYHVVRVLGSDARGNKLESAASLYVFGKDEAAFRGRDDGQVELVLDKKSYRVGEKARVLVKSPFPEARALISVERASVLKHEQRVFTGSMPSFEVEVTEDFVPNAFVSVHLVRKLTKGAATLPGGAYRVGYAEISIDPEPRRLSIEVTPKAKLVGPGDEVSVALRVSDRDGKPQRAELTVFAVDEGVLMLTGYTLPDPLRALSQPRGLAVATLETRRALSRIVPRGLADLMAMGKGDEGGGGGEDGARSDFRQTAYFNPSVIADERGVAEVKFRLPDSLTTYRVMALAVGSAERYGYGNSSITAQKPLMARPALPRFLRAGDRLDAGVVVSSNQFAPGNVTVEVRADGVLLEGPASKTIALGHNQSSEVRFGFRAERAGEARFEFSVKGGGARDRVEIRRPVSPPAVLEAVALSGSTDDVAAEGLGALTGVRPDVGGLEVSVASSALVGLDSSLGALMEYPYGCTEQLASRLVPLVPLRDLAKDFGVLPSDATTRIASTIREILARQQDDGGFAMWAGGTQSSPWISAYALWVLTEARARKEEIPANVFARGRAYLRRVLEREKSLIDAPTEAYVLDVLAALGDPDVGYMNRLFERRADLPVFGRALLLSAFGRGKQRGEAENALVRELEQSIRVSAGSVRVIENQGDAYARIFDSPTRTQALVLSALIRVRPKHPLLADLARGLMLARRGGTWRSTQETAHALLALDAYRKASEPEEPDFTASVAIGRKTLFELPFEGRTLKSESRKLPMSSLLANRGDGLIFSKDGTGTLFYQARLRYARSELPKTGFDSGFYVEKRLRRVDPNNLASLGLDTPSESKFKGGDLVVGDVLVVTSSARDFVVLDDPIPAGFEAVDTTFATTSAGQQQYDHRCRDCDDGPDRSIASPPRRELRDDRAVFFIDRMSPGIHRYRYLARATSLGRFVVPPARAEEMYAPETFGRTGAEVIEIR